MWFEVHLAPFAGEIILCKMAWFVKKWKISFDDPFLCDSGGIQILLQQFPKSLQDKEMVGSAILNKHLSWNNLTNHRALLAQPVSKSIFQNHKLEVLGLIEYGLRLEFLIRTLFPLWKGCENVVNTTTHSIESSHNWHYSRNLSIVLTDSLSRVQPILLVKKAHGHHHDELIYKWLKEGKHHPLLLGFSCNIQRFDVLENQSKQGCKFLFSFVDGVPMWQHQANKALQYQVEDSTKVKVNYL